MSHIVLLLAVCADDSTNYINLPRADSHLAIGASGDYFDRSRTAVVTDGTFKFATDTFQHILLAFVAPGCPNSKRLLPALDMVARQVAALELDHVAVAKIDGTANSRSAADFAIDGYPKLFWSRYSYWASFTGG